MDEKISKERYLSFLHEGKASECSIEVPYSRQIVKVAFSSSSLQQFSMHQNEDCPPKDEKIADFKENVGEYGCCEDNDILSSLSNIDIDADDLKTGVRPPPEKQYADINVLLKQQVDEASDTVFLIDAQWWQAWELFASSKSTTVPGPISNAGLILSGQSISDSYLKCKFFLRKDINEGKDFFRLSPEAWEALRSWYGGGPPLPRFLRGDSPEIDLWPSVVPSIAAAMYGELSSDSRAIPVQGPHIQRVVSFGFNDCGSGVQSGSNTAGDNSSYTPQTLGPSLQPKVCFVCKENSTLRCAKCSAVNYCTRTCQTVHWKFHKKWCKVAGENRSLSVSEFESKVPVGRRGRVGLFNLGNSCYMNSSLQCLSHIAPLTAYLISDRFSEHINKESFFGTGGTLAREYSNILQELWFESKAAIYPYSFKKLIGKLNPEYAGMAQQDAHELVEHLLDKLHEDVNLVKKKPYTEKGEGDGNNDSVISEEEWEKLTLRENSIVKDVVGSLFRSQLVCPDCNKISVSFEYHQTVQLAIPRSTLRPINVIYVPEFSAKKSNEATNNNANIGASGGGISSSAEVVGGSSSSSGSAAAAAAAVGVRPVLMAPLVDRIDTMGAVKRQVAGVVDGLSRANRANQSTSSLPDSGGGGLCMLELSSDLHRVTRIVDDNEPIQYSSDESCLVAYRLSDKLDGNLMLLQRKLGTDCNSFEDAKLIGLPIVLSFSLAWSCARVRVLVWQQVVRYLNKDPNLLPTELSLALAAASSSLDVKAQMKFARHLPLRLVDKLGRPLSSRVATDDHDAVEGVFGLSVDGGLGRKESGARFGSTVPYDTATSLAHFAGLQLDSSEIPFLSVDWSGEWLKLLNENEVDALSLHQSAVAAGIPDTTRTLTRFTDYIRSSKDARVSKGGDSASSALTLERCLAEHTREEQLDEDNAWYCSVCKKHQQAKKIVSFWKKRLPEVLVLTLKRFEFRDVSNVVGRRGISHREKIDTFVDFPLDGLDLSSYCAAAATSSPSSSAAGGAIDEHMVRNELNEDGSSTIYDLFAVCNHYGRMGFGHYTAFARDWRGDSLSPNWYSFDDNDVSPIQDGEVKTRAAYILFYRKRPSPTL